MRNSVAAVDLRKCTVHNGTSEVAGVPGIIVDIRVEDLKHSVFETPTFQSARNGIRWLEVTSYYCHKTIRKNEKHTYPHRS